MTLIAKCSISGFRGRDLHCTKNGDGHREERGVLETRVRGTWRKSYRGKAQLARNFRATRYVALCIKLMPFLWMSNRVRSLKLPKGVTILHITTKTIFLPAYRQDNAVQEGSGTLTQTHTKRGSAKCKHEVQGPDSNILTSKTSYPSNYHATHSPTSSPQPRTPSSLPPLSHSVLRLVLRLFLLGSLHYHHPCHPSHHHQPDSLHLKIPRLPDSRIHESNTSPSRKRHPHNMRRA